MCWLEFPGVRRYSRSSVVSCAETCVALASGRRRPIMYSHAVAGKCSREFSRRKTGSCERGSRKSVEHYAGSDKRGVTAILLLPCAIADHHHDGSAGLVVIRSDCPTRKRGYSKGGEIISGNVFTFK